MVPTLRNYMNLRTSILLLYFMVTGQKGPNLKHYCSRFFTITKELHITNFDHIISKAEVVYLLKQKNLILVANPLK